MLEEKNVTENVIPVKSTDETVVNEAAKITQPKKRKKSSALVAASMGRSAMGAVLGHASLDVRGSSDGTTNTGVIISYESEA